MKNKPSYNAYEIISPCCRKDKYTVRELHPDDVKCPKCGHWYNQADAVMGINDQIKDRITF